ncbi:MAG: hypothetical protein EOO10_10140 [Chitinophagaceae bacterium]|nr:MAG: hypothetical protein EOO10_10140 [Chitinophagaceae bacterium]
MDIDKAVRLNKKYEAELWGCQKPAIHRYFSSTGIVMDSGIPDEKVFASAVAKWQATVFQNKESIDGILGPNSWALLRSLIANAPAPALVQTSSRWHSIIKNTVPCKAVPLVQGKETFRQMVAAIKTATSSEHYIYILGWMLEVDFPMIPGDTRSTLIQLLTDASRRGVEIRVLIWDNPIYIKEISNSASKINALTNSVLVKDNATFGSPGIKSAISKIRFLLAQAPAFLRFISSWNSFVAKVNTIQNEGSHHEKVLVVKGTEGLIGFCGGIDINSNRVAGIDSLGRSTVLHDIHCEVRGHAAWVLMRRFIWRWQVYKAERTHNTFLSLYMQKPLLGEKEATPPVALPGTNTAHVKILQTYNHPGKNIQDRTIREAVKLAITNAKKTVHIEDQYMISLEIASWLNTKLANEPGFVSVTILTQDDSIAGEDILFAKQMRKKFIDQLVQGLPADLVRRKVFVQMLHPSVPPGAHHKIHSKVYIIDDELAIVGSANLSSRSMTHDSETAAVIFNDPGSVTNFALQLKNKEKADPDTNIIAYASNPSVKDMDVRIIDELNNLSTAKRIALSAAGPAVGLLIPQIITTLVTQFKPAIIDIIDPDADNTQPQQELEGWPEALTSKDQLYGEIDVAEEAWTNTEAMKAADSKEEFYPERGMPNEVETIGYNYDLENEKDPSFYPDDKKVAEAIEYQVAVVKSSPGVIDCEGYTCWAKTVLNNLAQSGLTIDNNINEQFKKAIGDFQVSNNLPQTQKLDAVTERALLEANALYRTKGTVWETPANTVINVAKTKIEDWTKQGAIGVKEKPVEIKNTFRDPRTVWAFVLHHMAIKRRSRTTNNFSDPASYLRTGAHFCILFDGRIIQLHPFSRFIWHAQCLSHRSVAVEFEGNFPDISGKWWNSSTGNDRPTEAQFVAGRFLASYLKVVLNTTHIHAHRQGSKSRVNDPGPDIWYNVGQWAVSNLQMTDGGVDFKCGDGNPILPEWRTWGNKTTATTKENYGPETEVDENQMEAEAEDNDLVYDQGQDEAFQNNDWLDGNWNETSAHFVEEQELVDKIDLNGTSTTGQPVILARGETTSDVSGEMHTLYKMYDPTSKKFVGERYDEQGNKITNAEIKTKEGEVVDGINNKIHPTLQLQILRAGDATPIEIAVWMDIDVKEPPKSNYQPNQLATMPVEIAQHRKKLAATIFETARKLTIERSGIQVQRVSDLLPLFFAKTTKRTIDLIKNDPLVLGIFFNDRTYFESLTTSLSRSGAAEAQAANMTTLGKDIKVAVWENAPDIVTNLTIEGYYDPARPNVSDHARLVSGIIKNKEAGKPKGYAPNCKLYSANLSGNDISAPLEWAVKQGCSVINRSFHQNTDQVNAGMQLSDFITDALAVRYPYPVIVQASGNTGQPDDTALGISPAGNEYVNHKGYNSLAVGSHDEQAERKISSFSTFRNPSSPHNDRELPEICALGENITAVGLVDWGGTSFASPAVAGSVAILQSISPVIKVYPEAVRALLLTGSKRNVDGGLWYQDLKRTPKVDQKDGTGALNIYESITIAKKPYQPKKLALDKGWDCGRLDASSFGPDKISLNEWKIIVPSDRTHVKISLAWNSNVNYTEIWKFKFLKDTTLDMDLDIVVFDAKNTLVAASSSFDNSYEIADYIAPGGQPLTVKLRSYSIKPTAWSYFGIAWTTF